MGDDDIRELLAAEAEASEEHRDAPVDYVRSTARRREPAQVYSLRIPVRRLAELREVADAHGTEPSVLMRRWVLDRLDAERAGGQGETVRAKLERARRLLEEVREAEEAAVPEG